MSTTMIQISPQELADLIETAVDSALDRKLAKWFQDGKKPRQPINFVWDDEGSVKPEVEEQLLRQIKEVEMGQRGIPLNEALSILGLDEHGDTIQI